MWDKEFGEITEGQPPLENLGLVLRKLKEMRKEVTGLWNDAASRDQRSSLRFVLCVKVSVADLLAPMIQDPGECKILKPPIIDPRGGRRANLGASLAQQERLCTL